MSKMPKGSRSGSKKAARQEPYVVSSLDRAFDVLEAFSEARPELSLMDIVAASGTGFAFPSQTTYLASDQSGDPERRTAAEEQVQAWRAAGRLPLPEFSPDAVAAVRGTLAYPDHRRRQSTESAA